MGKFLKLKEVYCKPSPTLGYGYGSPLSNGSGDGLFADFIRFTEPQYAVIPQDQILSIHYPVSFGYEPDGYAEWGDEDDVPIPGVWFDDATAIWVKHPAQQQNPAVQSIYVCTDNPDDIYDQID